MLGRQAAKRQRARLEQELREEELHRARRERRAAAEAAALEAAEVARADAERQKEAQLRRFRERRCAAEVMCQSLPRHLMPWEENSTLLLDMLEKQGKGSRAGDWLGQHGSRRAARRQYLALARQWHPDKWSLQGDRCVEVANDVTKCLVVSYEQLLRELPQEASNSTQDDDEEEKEVLEFASWVGISFVGMQEVWKERRGVQAAGK